MDQTIKRNLYIPKPPLLTRLWLMFTQDPLQWVACVLSMGGAQLLSSMHSGAAWGWVLYLCANAVFLVWGLRRRLMPFVLMQIYFSYTSINGIVNHLLR